MIHHIERARARNGDCEKVQTITGRYTRSTCFSLSWILMGVLLGSTRPRLFTPPLEANSRGLPVRTRGRELIKFAREIGEPFWPGQDELALRALELDRSGRYRFRIVIVLKARQNGKTRFLRVLALWRLFRQGAQLAIAVAQDRSRAFEVWEDALQVIEAHPDLSKRLGRVRRMTNDEYFQVLDEDGNPAGRYRIKAATRSSGRGPSADLVPFDELREQTDWQAWSALSKTIMAREDGQLFAFSNAGDRRSVVLAHLRSVALAGTDPSVGIFEWSGEDGCALDDRRAWAAANPSLGRGGVTEAAIRTAMASDPPDVFRTEVLCQFVSLLDHAVDPDAWMQSADPSLHDVRRDWVACVEVAPDSAHVALVLAAVLSDGRVRVEVAGAWSSTREAPATEHARRELPGLLKDIKPRKGAWFPAGPTKPLAPLLDSWGWDRITGGGVSEACMGFADLVAARLITHRAQELLTAHVAGAQRLPVGDGWVFVRLGAAHCDAAYAAAGAVHVARTLPPPLPPLSVVRVGR